MDVLCEAPSGSSSFCNPVMSAVFVFRLNYHTAIILLEKQSSKHSCFISALVLCVCSFSAVTLHELTATNFMADNLKRLVRNQRPSKSFSVFSIASVYFSNGTKLALKLEHPQQWPFRLLLATQHYACFTLMLLKISARIQILTWNHNFILLCFHDRWWNGIWRETWQ